MILKAKNWIHPIVLSYSEIFFLKGVLPGVVILGLSFLNPNLGISGLFSVISAYFFARFLGYQQEFLSSGFYTYNALLVGLSIGQLFSFSELTAIYIIIAAGLTLLITIALSDVFYRQYLLPILSVPFILVSSLIYLSASRFSNLYVNDLYAKGHVDILNDVFPVWIEGLLKSLGAIIFMPDVIIGLILILIISIHSRIILMLTLIGYYFGTFLQSLFTGSHEGVFHDLNAFNYPLIAIALGAVFNIPSLKSYFIALMGVAGATVLIKSIDVFWSQYNIPVFTLPFLMITLGSVYVLGLVSYPNRPKVYKRNPEETARYFHIQNLRYSNDPLLHLPFLDTWTVYQGFNGQWTHKGLWRYAYDFVKTDKKGSMFKNEGKNLEDYYCFLQPVSAPCKGIVAYTADYFPNNPIGSVDQINNWGNYVIIHNQQGYYVGICHLSQYSLTVKVGDWVEPGQVIGYCGNSGYSPVPHIHMQYQSSSLMTSSTLPFKFTNYQTSDQYYPFGLPDESKDVSPVYAHLFYSQLTNFILNDEYKFEVFYHNKSIDIVKFTVGMALDGSYYLGRNDSRLYLGKIENTFYFYTLEGNDPYLKLLYQALPSMPLNFVEKRHWLDIIPESYFKLKLQWLAELKLLLYGNSEFNAKYHFTSDTTIQGEIKMPFSKTVNTYIELDAYLKFKSIQVGAYKLIATNKSLTQS